MFSPFLVSPEKVTVPNIVEESGAVLCKKRINVYSQSIAQCHKIDRALSLSRHVAALLSRAYRHEKYQTDRTECTPQWKTVSVIFVFYIIQSSLYGISTALTVTLFQNIHKIKCYFQD